MKHFFAFCRRNQLFAALLGRKKLSDEQIEQLRQIVGELE